jgi:hypothetical protein
VSGQAGDGGLFDGEDQAGVAVICRANTCDIVMVAKLPDVAQDDRAT